LSSLLIASCDSIIAPFLVSYGITMRTASLLLPVVRLSSVLPRARLSLPHIYIYIYKWMYVCVCSSITLERLERLQPNLEHIWLYVYAYKNLIAISLRGPTPTPCLALRCLIVCAYIYTRICIYNIYTGWFTKFSRHLVRAFLR
jgi:hypothetical protein